MSSPTIKAVLRVKGDKEVREAIPHAVAIRVTIDRKKTFKHTGVRVLIKNWDAANGKVIGHPIAKDYNKRINAEFSKCINEVTRQNVNEKTVTAKSIRSAFKGKSEQNFFAFVEKLMEDVKGKRSEGTLNNYERHLRKLEEYHGSRDLDFSEITPDFLNGYERHLRDSDRIYKGEEKKFSKNYVSLLIRDIKVVFKAAIKQKLITDTPFDTYESPKPEDVVKDYLSLPELYKWEVFAKETNNPALKEAAIYYLFGCYTGLRISDWRRFDAEKQITENGTRILLRAKKNGGWVGMPINKGLARVLELVKEIPLVIADQTLNEKLKIIAGELGIKKDLTAHTARHTFAVTLCAEQGIGVETAAELMAITFQVCMKSYYRVNRQLIDTATKQAWDKL